MKKFLAIACSTALVLAGLTGCGSDTSQAQGSNEKAKPIVITGKKFTEQYILPNILAEYIKAKTDYDVEVKEGLGEAPVITQALKDGDVDLMVGYTGTGLLTVLKDKLKPDDTADSVYQRVKDGYKEKFNLVWTKPLGFNNTYALALRGDQAKKLGVSTMSELVGKAGQLTFGAPPEFYEREDGYDAMNKKYGSKFKDTVDLDANIMYDAIKEGKVDVITAYTTDGRISRYHLKLMKDDKKFFPPYYAAPVVRQETLDTHPGLEKVLNELAGTITEDKMAELNARVDMDKQEPSKVAKDFLKEEGLIK